MRTEPGFVGAKLALLSGPDLVTLLRDDYAHIPWPAHWDVPGGEREGQETPEACVLRETREELGLSLTEDRLIWRRPFRNQNGDPAWFFVAEITAKEVEAIRFGGEGQGWAVMPVADYLSHPKAIPTFQDMIRAYLQVR